MKTRTHFAHRIDMLDAAGEIREHLAGRSDTFSVFERARWLASTSRMLFNVLGIMRITRRCTATKPPTRLRGAFGR
jgi:hypothetical protein